MLSKLPAPLALASMRVRNWLSRNASHPWTVPVAALAVWCVLMLVCALCGGGR